MVEQPGGPVADGAVTTPAREKGKTAATTPETRFGGQAVRSAVIWDYAGLVGKQVAAFGVSIVLARLLDPAEFGIVGIALAFIGISSAVFDSGFNAALLQSANVTERHFSSVFLFNALVGTAFAGVLFAVAPYIAQFYQTESFAGVLRWLSLTVVFNALSQVQIARFQRQLAFRTLALRDLLSTACAGAIGILMAVRGFGVYSLVGQQLVFSSCQLAVLWISSNWRPSSHFSLRDIRQLGSFSLFVFLDTVTSSVVGRADALVLGKVFSPALLGQFVRANTLNLQITVFSTESIRKVLFPVMSRLQGNPKLFQETYYAALSTISFGSIFLAGLLYIWSEALIIGLFGLKWATAVFVFRVIIFRSINVSLDPLMTNAFLTQGLARDQFKFGLARRTLSRLVPLAIGVVLGFEAFLYSAVITSFLSNLLYVGFLHRKLLLRIGEQLVHMYVMAIPLAVLLVFDVGSVNYPRFVAYSGVFVAAFLGFGVATKNLGMYVLWDALVNKTVKLG